MDFILAVGGGSVIDCCKIVSVQATNEADLWDLENGQHKMPAPGIPMGAVVTIFGTGAEMNAGAVITNEELHVKRPLFGTSYSWAALDPALTLTAPMASYIAEKTGADIFEITAVDAYPTDYTETGNRARDERDGSPRHQ